MEDVPAHLGMKVRMMREILGVVASHGDCPEQYLQAFWVGSDGLFVRLRY